MRKLFILQSLRHAPGYPISFHKLRVKMSIKMWDGAEGKAQGDLGQFITELYKEFTE